MRTIRPHQPTEHRRRRACCASVLAAPLDEADAAELAQGFTALADPVRLRVLSILAAAPDGEVCVCDFVGPLGKSQPTVSHHLKILSRGRPGPRRPAGQVGLVLAQPGPPGRAPGPHRRLTPTRRRIRRHARGRRRAA